MTNSFSKFAEQEDQEVADMYFIDNGVCENLDIPYDSPIYYIDGELYIITDNLLHSIRDPDCGAFTICVKFMKQKYEWYYEEEYDVMKHIKAHKGNKEKTLRAIYNNMDYPTLRYAECPYACEGCRIMHCCGFCGGQVSHCKSFENLQGEETTHFCDEDCLFAYVKPHFEKTIKKNVFDNFIELKRTEEQLVLCEKYVKSKNKLIHFPKGCTIDGKSTIMKSELETYIKKLKIICPMLKLHNLLLKRFLIRDKTDFQKNFEIYKELLDDFMAIETNDNNLMEFAKQSKEEVEYIENYAEVFFGIKKV